MEHTRKRYRRDFMSHEFTKGLPPVQQQRPDGRFTARAAQLRQDLYTPEFTTWRTPGKGFSGESQN